MYTYLTVFLSLTLPGGEDAQVVDALRAGFKQWREEVEFHSTFRLRRGTARSVEAGLRGEFEPPAKPEGDLRGVCHKLRNKLRYSIDFGRPPVAVTNPLPNQQQVSSYTRASFDEVTNNEIDIRYEPSHGQTDLADTVEIQERLPKQRGQLRAGIHSEFYLGPLNLLPQDEPDLFVINPYPPAMRPPPVAAKVELGPRSRDECTIVITYDDGEHGARRELVFATNFSPPIIKAIHDKSTYRGKPQSERHVQCSEFRRCTNGDVPAVIRYVFLSNDAHGNPAVSVEEWRSDDLGRRAPSDEDFVIEISPSTYVGGVRNAPPRGTTRRIDIDDYPLERVYKMGETVLMDSPEPPPSHGKGRWILTIVGIIAVLGVVLLAVWRWRLAARV
jgi:hypothetical protein